MNINLTLIGQTITFAIFVWFCMKFIWPPIVLALETRRKQVADGLAAGDRGRHELELAAKRATESLHEAKMKAAEIIAHAEKRSAQIVDEAKNAAKIEGEHMLAAARAEMEQDVFRAREQLRGRVAELVVAGAEKVLRREVDASAHADLLEAIKNEF
ncbi:MAG: F0F1 ATP synthase subunit B [Hydrogenophilales bacterium CG03_land_8_20_14_0_80_62_28]|nr:F0F1 ATP synthase subunit B [Betaproteobacteria bacterium]OIO77048.1 MAG: F0F1 ATP synthase subunit B [Hydrogenophilaceae bacterium CG1_02_62_390]PIV22621.1 MAG: F0F1 ATP synthase subunit B [Hydrogenophilales bacterium CG03_land_8_20_14_0_80_62_28]PIW38207.1 MAG: F0F1 ATP synthase subunit B [Hydrogenophilales bacterium CG15_BIG_FIL_POST_REV_8_21_14_020_62_31]PIW72370.1 MAG: F0F1 ATP synthase subunit B [Hydrogenophilales bacterium CG12_big_fil_rev_8_21_14_0_65_61_21]PIX00564.1 MAG: F0F1 ATP 